MLALSANPERFAEGVVLEAKMERGRGAVAVVLVQKGTLHRGDYVVLGSAYGRVRAIVSSTGENLKEAGVSPEDVDLVICTHLHVDHVGWNTRAEDGRWVPTFPKARYVFGRAEFEHWTSGDGPRLFPENVAVIEDSVIPVVEAGLVDFVEAGDTILPGLTVEAVPGHTATQLAVKYERSDGSFICTADVLHQPIQIYEPDYNSCFCEDGEAARATRRRILDYCAESGALLMPMHFGPPHAGYVRRDGSGYRFEPATPAGRTPS